MRPVICQMFQSAHVQRHLLNQEDTLEQRQKLMQFLKHLNDEYEAIRGQILLLDPLPTVNKAYSMIQRVKRQRHVTNTI